MKLFNGQRTNPNGCPIAATFYVSDGGNNYHLVRELHIAGHEIGDHSVSHRMPQSWWGTATRDQWQQEMGGQLDNLVERGQVPRDQVRGARSPYLELGADRQFSVLSDLQFRYDSTFMTGPYSEDPTKPYSPAWPFTLDFPPYPYIFCDSKNCPTSQYPGMWEVPLNRWMGLDHQACSMMDACASQGTTKEDTLKYMWNNFNRHYKGNRAPFGIFLHPVWFDRGEHRFPAMVDFIDGLLKTPNVYIVTVNQALDWMQSPTNSSGIKDFAPWQHNCGKKKILVEKGTLPPSNDGMASAIRTAMGIPTYGIILAISIYLLTYRELLSL